MQISVLLFAGRWLFGSVPTVRSLPLVIVVTVLSPYSWLSE